MAKHELCLKLGSKPTQLYVRLSIIPLSQQANHVSSGIIRNFEVTFFYLHFCLTVYIFISFSWSCLKLIPLPYDQKSLRKPETFDSITIHTDSHSQKQKLQPPPLKTAYTSLSIYLLTCFLSLYPLPPSLYLYLLNYFIYFRIFLNVEKLKEYD